MRRLLGLTLLLASLLATAETSIPDMKFRRLDTRDGLSNATINYLFQDSKGFIWIGTSYGLNRYDGYRFRTFYSDPNDTTTLRNNYVDMIWEDIDGKLWLKQGMNFSVFDPVTEHVVRNPATIFSKWGIKGGIDRFYIDSDKNYWVKTYDDGIFCYNPRTKKRVLTKYGYGPEEFPKEFWISSFGEYDGKLLVASSNGDMMAIDGQRGKVVWKDSYMRQNGGLPNEAYTIRVDNEGNYWVLTNQNTYVYEPKAKKWYDTLHSFLESKGISGLPAPLQVWDITIDKRGWLWLATDHQGVFVIDMKTKQLKQFTNNKFDETSLSDNTVKVFLLDKSGSVWMAGYRNGLNQYIETLSGFRLLEIGDVNTTTEDKQGNYWFGTDNRGAIKYVPATGETVVYDKATSGLASDIMVASYGASDGSVWFGTYNGGLIQIDNGKVKNYLATNAEGGLANNNVWSVTEDKWGDIWIGTLGSGVQKLQRRTGKFLSWNSYNNKLPENFMTSASWIKKGWLLVGHSNFYSLINPVSGEVKNVTIPTPPGQAAPMAASVCVVEDSRELIWYGSTAGCCIFDPKTGRQQLLDMNSGLLGSSVGGICEDKLHTMWVVTDHGISNVVPKKEDNGEWSFLVRSFSVKDGLQQGPYNKRSISCTHDGLILVGGVGGVDIINPRLITNVDNDERPVFSGLKLFDQQVAVGQAIDGRVILDEALDACRELTLKYYENQFTIQLASNKGEIHNPSRFIYQLEGFSDKWMKTEENNPNITYMSLHHGSYILHVRMLNGDGTMGKEEAVLKITVTPPLLRNRWLMLLFIACVAGGVWFWRKRFMEKQAERAELERLRTETEKKHWMSEMRKQLRAEMGGQAKEDAEAPVQQPADVKERIDLVQVFREECEQFVAPKGKSIRLSFFPFADTLPVIGSRLQMREMIEILLANSANFSPSGSKVKVFAEQQGDKAVIRVADNGVGIPTAVMPHLFEQIVGDDDSPNLHAVFDIVMSHGGTIRADENNGGGTVFVIELPLCKGDGDVEEAEIV